MPSSSDSELDPHTLSEICYILYCKGLGENGMYRQGSSCLVFDLIFAIEAFYEEEGDDSPFNWRYCEPCDKEVPEYKDSGCLICSG